VRLVRSRTALALVAIPVAELALHGNVPRRALIVVPLSGMALHGHALHFLVAGLGIHAELLVQKSMLLVELASCLREFVKPHTLLGVGVGVLDRKPTKGST
jgi:hypothetical protein